MLTLLLLLCGAPSAFAALKAFRAQAQAVTVKELAGTIPEAKLHFRENHTVRWWTGASLASPSASGPAPASIGLAGCFPPIPSGG